MSNNIAPSMHLRGGGGFGGGFYLPRAEGVWPWYQRRMAWVCGKWVQQSLIDLLATLLFSCLGSLW